jgi:hypothetical protein
MPFAGKTTARNMTIMSADAFNWANESGEPVASDAHKTPEAGVNDPAIHMLIELEESAPTEMRNHQYIAELKAMLGKPVP